MANATSDDEVKTITCPSCEYTVLHAPGTKRTICPNCGNFYKKEAGDLPPPPSRKLGREQDQRTLPLTDDVVAVPQRKLGREQNRRTVAVKVTTDKNGREKTNGRLQTIANFFHNLSNRQVNNSNRQTNIDRPSSTGSNTSSRCSSAAVHTELPPIDGNTRLTTRGHGSHLKPNSPRDGVQSQSPNSLQTPRSPREKIGVSRSPIDKSFPQTQISTPVPKIKTVEQLREEVGSSKVSGNWKNVKDYYAAIFDSFAEINVAFKKETTGECNSADDPGLKFDHIYAVYDILLDVPQDLQKVVLKALINSLLKDKRPHSKDDLRAYLVLLQNPQFGGLQTYMIFAHLLRQVAALTDQDHHFLVHWIKKIPRIRFKSILARLQNFVSLRLFPPKAQDLPPLSRCTWWIPSATKVMALMNAANKVSSPAIVMYTDFYNSTLDRLDLMAEYYAWQNPSSHAGFSFCQYPFIMSISAKRTILQRDSEQQMIIMARRSLVAKVQRRQLPDVGMLFLNLNVRRTHLVSDSLNEIANKQHDLKKKLKVTFAGEPGLDMGGLTKEWFLLLIRQIFQPEYGMFNYDKKAGVHWFSSAHCDSFQEFNLVGVLMGLAVYNSIILDIHFPLLCYKKLLSPAVVPYNNPRAVVGVLPLKLDDLKTIQPDVAQGLYDLLNYDGDVEDDFAMTFQISQMELGSLKTYELKSGGTNIPVNNQNRKEYVDLYVDWVLNRSVYQQFQAFYHGFHTICASNALIMLRPEEIETLVCGSPNLDMRELKKVTVYDGYTASDPTIRCFWDTVLALPLELQKRLLLFATGSDRIPIGGMSEMQLKISRVDGQDLLPMSHTCFNQLILPAYRSKKVLRQKLTAAIQNAEGFGLE